MSLVTWVLVLTCVSGCKVATQADVVFDAEAGVRERAVLMQVQVSSGAGDLVFMQERPLTGPNALPWPNVLPLVPGQDQRSFSMRASLLDAEGQEFSVQRLVAGFVERRRETYEITFTDACVGILCDPTTTCVSAACVDATQSAGEEGRRADRQGGACFGERCFEHPRPGAARFSAACIGSTGDDEPPLELVAGTSGLILRREGDVWVQEPTGDPGQLVGLDCWDEEAIAVGQGGAIYLRSGDGVWTRASVGDTNFRAVSGASAADAWVVGAAGVVLRRQADGFVAVDAGLTRDLRDVYSPRPEEAWIADGSPTLTHYVDGAWESVPVPGIGVIAVDGREGELLVLSRREGETGGQPRSYDGSRWTAASPFQDGATSLDVSPSGHASASGGRGLYLTREPDGQWTSRPGVDGLNLEGTASGADRQLFVGLNSIGRLGPDGAQTEEAWRLTTAHLRAVAHSNQDPTVALAAGNSGTILYRPRPGIWRREPALEDETPLGSDLHAIVAIADRWVLVGDGVVIERPYGDAPMFSVNRPVTEPLLSVAASSAQVVAVGGASTIVERLDVASWRPFADPFPIADTRLTAVFVEDGGTLIVGTEGGEVWRHRGSWERVGMVAAPVACLRPAGDAVLGCGEAVFRVEEASLRALSLRGLTSPVRDVVGDVDGTVQHAVTTHLYSRREDDRFTLGTLFPALSLSRGADYLFVGASGQIARAEL